MTILSGSERWPTIHKTVPALRVMPNLVDYDATCGSFSWEEERKSLSGLPGGGGMNIAYEAVDRHATGPLAAKDALRFVHLDGTVDALTYEELAERTDRFASVLRDLGVGRGERVFSILGRCVELYVAALGTLKNASVFSPLFSAFGPEPVRPRMKLGSARVLVTTRALYSKKVAPIRDDLATLEHVLLVDGEDDAQRLEGTLDLHTLMRDAPPTTPIARTDGDDMALLHFTSGTTGLPKGAIHVHDAVVAHAATGRFALDLHPDDVYWCTADPGWVTGMS